MLKTVPKLNLTIPDHTILDKIGEGGMSAVYLGRQISLQRKVAIKVLKKLVMDDKSLAERFVNEAKTVASLDHPHIISIYEAKKLPSGLAYFTMPYLTHGDLGEIICTNSDHLIDLLCQICEGLAHAHKHGVIHRDLKPENVLFDQFGRIKIADFGIAISKKAKRKTKDTQLLGSAHYMSPEQIQSKHIDYHTDIYSLGCIIYEKLTGDHVYNANNDFSILMSHINKPIPELPQALSSWQPIINKCLAKAPEDRYQSVEEVKDALLEIKYSKATDKHSKKIKTKLVSHIKHPYVSLAAVLLLAVVLVLTWVFKDSSESNQLPEIIESNVVETTANQELTAAESNKESEPLTLTVGVIDPNAESAEDAEMVDLTGNLDNEQINEMSIEVTLSEGQELLEQYRLTKPKGENAADKFQKILLEQPDHAEARQGLNRVGVYYFRLIDSKLNEGDTPAALKHIESVVGYIDSYKIDRELFNKQVTAIINMADQRVKQAVQVRRKNLKADDFMKMAMLLAPNSQTAKKLKSAYDSIPQKGDIIKDKSGLQFVFMPVVAQKGLNDFMVGQSEITVAQFQAFAGEKFTDEKCHHYGKRLFFKKTWLKPPFDQQSNHPVVCISYDQAQAYADWLSNQHGATYRLPTVQEWQYINQQINHTHSCEAANIAGSESESKATDNPLECSDNFVFTAAVNSFSANTNIYDFNGNVAEWVSDCSGVSCAAGTSWQSGLNINNTRLETIDSDQTHSHVGFRLIKEI